MSHLREQFLAEDLSRRSVAEAFTRCLIEPIADLHQIGGGYGQGIDVPGKPFPRSPICIFDRSFLPGRLWVTKPCLRAYACLKVRPVSEFGASVECQRSAGEVREAHQRLDDAIHDRAGLAIIVAQQDREAAHPLNKRCHVGLAVLLPELNQIAFPMPELLAFSNDIRTMQNVEFRAKPLTMLTSCMLWSLLSSMLRQVTPQLDGMTVGRVCELVNCLVADKDRMLFQPHATGDLLGRPTMHDPDGSRCVSLRFPCKR